MIEAMNGGGGNLVTGDNYYREYNGLGQLIRVRDGNNNTTPILEEYFYDSNGDRIKIYRYSYNGGTNETIYTPYKEWMQIRNSSGTFNFYYIYQGSTLVARLNPDGTKYFYHPDHLGSTSLITDQNGNVVENEFFSPFGESLSANNAEENKLYTGQFKDSTGMYYYGARYYLPETGMFIQCDKMKNLYSPQGLNCYSYVLNNPYKYQDPNGENPVLVVAGLIGYAWGAYDYLKTASYYETTPLERVGMSFVHGSIGAASAIATVATVTTGGLSGTMRIAPAAGKAGLTQAGKLFGIGASEYALHQSVEGKDINALDLTIAGSLNAINLNVPSLIPGTYVSSSNPFAKNSLNIYGQYVIGNLINSGYSQNLVRQIISNTLTGSIGTRLGSNGRYFEYVTPDGKVYPTGNPNWKPGQTSGGTSGGSSGGSSGSGGGGGKKPDYCKGGSKSSFCR